MILKRPYAFLVKHFRIIHAILMVCSGFLLYKTWNIISLLGKYIRNKNSVLEIEDLASKYVTGLMYFIILIILALCGVIIYLLRYKRKPILFYLYVLAMYVVMLISYYLVSSFFYGMQFNDPSLRLVNIIRDVFRALAVLQIPVVGLAFIRFLGFDVRKFEFKSDLLELGVEVEDNEEYEFELNIDKDDLKTKLNKRMRLLKYFYRENKLLFSAIEIVLGVIVIFIVGKYVLSREKIYKEGQKISMSSYNITVLDTYKTYKDFRGSNIATKYFYVIAKIRYQNVLDYDYFLNTGNIKLSYSKYDSTTPTTELNNKLTEFGVNYYKQIIKSGESRDFVFIFEVPIEYYNNSFKLNFLNNLSYSKKGDVEYEYKKVKISPKEFANDIEKVATKNMQEDLTFTGSLLGDTTIKINDIKLNDVFYYNVYKCSKGSCNDRTMSIVAKQNSQFDFTLMRINYDISFDYEQLGKNYTNADFISQYGSIRFEINGKEYNNRIELTDVTPYVTNKYVFVQVRDKLKYADKIYLDFTIRDKVYTYVLKDNTKDKDLNENETEESKETTTESKEMNEGA